MNGSMHSNDWTSLLLQKLALAFGLHAAGANKTEINAALVQSAQQDVIDHLNAHPQIATGDPVTHLNAPT